MTEKLLQSGAVVELGTARLHRRERQAGCAKGRSYPEAVEILDCWEVAKAAVALFDPAKPRDLTCKFGGPLSEPQHRRHLSTPRWSLRLLTATLQRRVIYLSTIP